MNGKRETILNGDFPRTTPLFFCYYLHQAFLREGSAYPIIEW